MFDEGTLEWNSTFRAEPWLSVLSVLSELSEHCRTSIAVLSDLCRTSAFLTVTTLGHCHAMSCTVGAVGAVGLLSEL